MTINKRAFDAVGVTEKEYLDWCKQTHKPAYKSEIKTEFFARIQDGRLVRNADGKIVKKNRK